MNDDFDSWGGVWDVIKFKIKDHSIRVGKTRKNNRRNLKKELEASIDSINDKIRYGDGDLEELYRQLHESQHQLNNIISEEINGVITRSRAQWVEEGERSTKYFLGLEKSASKKSRSPNW